MPNFPLSVPFPSSADHIFSISVAKTDNVYICYIIVIFFILFSGWLEKLKVNNEHFLYYDSNAEPRSELEWTRIAFLSLQSWLIPVSLEREGPQVCGQMNPLMHYPFQILLPLSWFCVWIMPGNGSWIGFLSGRFPASLAALLILPRSPPLESSLWRPPRKPASFSPLHVILTFQMSLIALFCFLFWWFTFFLSPTRLQTL